MSDEPPEVDPARARIGEILRGAIEPPDDEVLEDETRRLMLHLSLEPVARAEPARSEIVVRPRRRWRLRGILGSLLRRLWGKRFSRPD
ncbi:hypothetical protein [Sphingomonas sp. M1-B02]|uniref:hypothetical protein n=1 Tax=Sphingomonas sp. M1-B02 TaxID=3114300 RepID=UPI00224033F6|nr:hypothetical protein [Sphingomonas sp. S6-11]UZK67153.1 hypothetical protein OKW87_04800 [Sphingomonas sp. S6-11]